MTTLGLLTILATGFARTAESGEWQIIGSRYHGMGGAGVAVVDDSLSLYWNPGALAFAEGRDFKLPFGVSVVAEGDIMTEIDELDLFARDLLTLRNKVRNGEPLSTSDKETLLQLVGRDIPLFREDDEAFLAGTYAALLGRTGRFAFGVLANGEAVILPVLDNVNLGLSGAPTPAARIADFVGPGADRSADLSASGQTLADAIADDFRAFTNTGLEQDQAEEFVFLAESAGLITSNGSVRAGLRQSAQATASSPSSLVSENISGAAAVTLVTAETTLAYGHPFFEKVGIGAAIRYIYGNTFVDYTTFYEVDSVRELIKETLEFNNRQDGHDFGIDVGVLVKPFDWLRIGIVARNLNEPEFKVKVPGEIRTELRDAGVKLNRFVIDRQARLGVAIDVVPWWTLALDIDLTKNKSEFVTDFESRLLSFGTEVRMAYRWFSLALRGGAFMNIGADQNQAPTITGGFGLGFGNFTLDFAGSIATERDRFESIGTNDHFPIRVGFAGELGYRITF